MIQSSTTSSTLNSLTLYEHIMSASDEGKPRTVDRGGDALRTRAESVSEAAVRGDINGVLGLECHQWSARHQ